jgi:hypothetical protein
VVVSTWYSPERLPFFAHFFASCSLSKMVVVLGLCAILPVSGRLNGVAGRLGSSSSSLAPTMMWPGIEQEDSEELVDKGLSVVGFISTLLLFLFLAPLSFTWWLLLLLVAAPVVFGEGDELGCLEESSPPVAGAVPPELHALPMSGLGHFTAT